MSSSLQNNPKRFDVLTGIRAIAAIMVFLYHFRKFWRDDIPLFVLKFLNEFHTGVSLFFVLSGFLIAYTYEDRPLTSSKEYIKYILTRIVRIFPVYLVLLSLKYWDEGLASSKEMWLNYTLLKGFSDMLNLTGIPQSWSLTVELSFYVLAPLIFKITKRNIWYAFIGLLTLLLITISIGYLWHYQWKNPDRFLYDWFFVLNTTFMGRFPEFLAGILLAFVIQNKKYEKLILIKKNSTLFGGIALLACIYIISLFEKDIYSHGTAHIAGLALQNVILPLFTIHFFYGLITESTLIQKFFSTRAMVLLGNASYIFYLLHISYGYRLVEKIYLFPDNNFILLWVVSVTAYLLIEKPVYNISKKWIRRL